MNGPKENEALGSTNLFPAVSTMPPTNLKCSWDVKPNNDLSSPVSEGHI